MKRKAIFSQSVILLSLILLSFLIAALYNIATLPADWFGDITIVNFYVLNILAGKWPFYFLTSGGPFYMYLVAPVIAIFGVSFLTYKLFSIFIAGAGLVAIYFFIKELTTKRIALLTTFLTAFSFWYLVWARLGNYNIIVPGITALMMYFLIKYLKTHRTTWLALSIGTSCLGLFTYAGTFLLPVVLLICLLWDMVIRTKKLDRKRLLHITLFFLPGIAFFAFIMQQSPDFASNGYMGTKFTSAEALSLNESITRTLRNIVRTLGMLHIEGDIVFRWNVSRAPLLDAASGFFFLIGLTAFIRKEKKFLPYILLPLVLLPIPSILPGHPPVEIPSSSRTMAIIPFVFFLVAVGIETINHVIKKRSGILWSGTFLFLSLCLISYLNLFTYFVRYPQQLPNKNVSFGKEIAAYLDAQNPFIPVYIPALGWGQWAQPNADSIYYSLKNKSRAIIKGVPPCNHTNAFIIILNPRDETQLKNLKSCFPKAVLKLHAVKNQQVFVSFTN